MFWILGIWDTPKYLKLDYQKGREMSMNWFQRILAYRGVTQSAKAKKPEKKIRRRVRCHPEMKKKVTML